MQFSAQPLPSQDANPEEEAKYKTAPDHRQESAFHPPDFSNFEEAHKPKSNLELIRAYGIFTTCQIRPIVQHADTLLEFTKKVLGSTITYGLVRATFFGHFCAGRTSPLADLPCFGFCLICAVKNISLCVQARKLACPCLSNACSFHDRFGFNKQLCSSVQVCNEFWFAAASWILRMGDCL